MLGKFQDIFAFEYQTAIIWFQHLPSWSTLEFQIDTVNGHKFIQYSPSRVYFSFSLDILILSPIETIIFLVLRKMQFMGPLPPEFQYA